ncbi:glycosyltransferase family 2 protein [Acidipila sp. EB88]|uniref:glycosyltransferase family 2 protein n=1 Tax=Acidipila sp. EB88 TaxID=2305226 RepID=UPI000F5FF1FB|nr:glycosyltransferase family 2 protein [Acidipila sp. EB88]RRA47456.1 glycosyltransferase family 2 protein [Acidipila sp. EB88]
MQSTSLRTGAATTVDDAPERPLRISVAMCTYNGERYLPQQLASILAQSRMPDELVVCDDRSQDQTLRLLEEFARHAPFSVRVVVNEGNLGSTRNFEQCILLCTGDLIALSDQDDVWHRDRLAVSEQKLITSSEAGLVFSDATLIDEEGRTLPAKLWESIGFAESSRRALHEKDYTLCLRTRFVTGATAMFRTSLRDQCLPVGRGWIHDEWIAAATPLFAEIEEINAPLICYRKHAAQQIGPVQHPSLVAKARADWMQLWGEQVNHWSRLGVAAAAARALCGHFAEQQLPAKGTARLGQYQAVLAFLEFRQRLPRSRVARLIPVLKALSRYRKHAGAAHLRFAGLGDILRDLLFRK